MPSPVSGENVPSSPEDIESLQFSIRAANVGFWEVDLATNTVKWDGRCQELFGLTKDYFIPYSDAVRYIHTDDLESVNEAVRKALAGEKDGIYDMRYRTIGAGDGKLRWVHFSGRVYFNDEKQPIRFGGIAQDITDAQLLLKQAEQTLIHNEERFRNIVEQSPMAIGILRGRDMVVELGNDAIFQIWGKTKAIIGKGLLDALPEIRDQVFMSLLQEVYDTGKPFYGSAALARLERGGQMVDAYFNFSYTPVRTDGAISGIMVLATEVTEIVLARKSIEESEAKLKAVISSAPAAISLFTGPDLVVEMPNQAFINIAGRGREIIGKPLGDAMPELRDQPFMQILDNVYRSGKAYEALGMPGIIIQDGIEIPHYFNFSYTPLLDNEGKVYAILDITHDVTEEILNKRKIEESEAFLKQAVEVAELATWSIDVATSQLSYSSRLYDWFGFDPENGEIDDVFALVDEDDRQRVQEAITKAITPGTDGVFDEEFTIRSFSTGRKRVLHSQGKTLLNEEGQPLKLVGTAQDITVHRQMQMALEQEIQQRTSDLDASNEELQAANEELATTNEELSQSNENLSISNQDLQQFAHVTSHDLKEPLRKIKTFLSRLEADKENVYSAKSVHFIEKMNHSLDRMRAMIEGILSYSRINGSEQKMEPVDINVVFSEILTDLEVLITEKGASVQFGQLPVIDGSSVLIHQLFYNLLTNSLKFASPDRPAQISISASLTHRNKIPFYRIEVADNGIGFDQKYAEKIFTTFTRLNPKDRYEGTGLGLALCKKIVQRHHGSIAAFGEIGKGARFVLSLPKDQPYPII